MEKESGVVRGPSPIKLSVIVPVYNVEEYLDECLVSILGQSFFDMEVILVDDGSPDGSSEIMEKHAQADERIKVIHQKNGGISKARNAGLDIASGEYVTFVDSDDLIHQEMYEKLLKAMAQNDADLGECSFQRFRGVVEGKNQNTEQGEIILFNSNKEIFHGFLHKNEYAKGIVWNKIYRRRIFEAPGKLRFKEGAKAEDGEIILKILDRCNGYAFLPEELYYYRQRDDSNITANRGSNLGLRMDAINALMTQLDIIKSKNFKPDEISEFLWRISKVMINSYYVMDKELKEHQESAMALEKIRPVIRLTADTLKQPSKKLMLNLFLLSPEVFWHGLGKWYKKYYLKKQY